MTIQGSIRQTHRWISMAFTATVVANFVWRIKETPPAWVTYAPLLPLFILLLTGCYMFARPYLVRDRTGSEVIER